MKCCVIGTAGHVDHGKTALIQALTGHNTDRLPEEQKRGISIELGFAPWALSPDLLACVVDVPGHDQFVRTMIKGAQGIDAALIVVAADEGPKPQTFEHLEILTLLGIRHAVCALTKIDLVTPDELAAKLSSTQKALSMTSCTNAAVVPVSAKSGLGLDVLKREVLGVTEKIRRSEGALILPIDRVFQLPGFGTIVTGTLDGGTLELKDRLAALPGGDEFQVRSLQIFNQPVERAEPGTRVAVNLVGPERGELRRGMTLVRPGEISPTDYAKVSLRWLKIWPWSKMKRQLGHLRLISGTQDLPVQLIVSSSEFPDEAEIRTSAPWIIRKGDKFILRTESPPRTIAGGEAVEFKKQRLKPEKVAAAVSKPKSVPSPFEQLYLRRIQATGLQPPTVDELSKEEGEAPSRVHATLATWAQKGELVRISDQIYVVRQPIQALTTKLQSYFKESPALTMADWKGISQVSRKYAVPILEYLDRERYTICRPDRTRIPGPRLKAN